jgi:separase
MLYQGRKHGLAVQFLKQGCALGVKAQNMHHIGGMSEDGGWKQLREQLYHRWELLGVCYLKIGDRKVGVGSLAL